ncbi:hypothetical protein YC2023_025712 [Brassica napus]
MMLPQNILFIKSLGARNLRLKLRSHKVTSSSLRIIPMHSTDSRLLNFLIHLTLLKAEYEEHTGYPRRPFNQPMECLFFIHVSQVWVDLGSSNLKSVSPSSFVTKPTRCVPLGPSSISSHLISSLSILKQLGDRSIPRLISLPFPLLKRIDQSTPYS